MAYPTGCFYLLSRFIHLSLSLSLSFSLSLFPSRVAKAQLSESDLTFTFIQATLSCLIFSLPWIIILLSFYKSKKLSLRTYTGNIRSLFFLVFVRWGSIYSRDFVLAAAKAPHRKHTRRTAFVYAAAAIFPMLPGIGGIVARWRHSFHLLYCPHIPNRPIDANCSRYIEWPHEEIYERAWRAWRQRQSPSLHARELWWRICIGESATLADLPASSPLDTWFLFTPVDTALMLRCCRKLPERALYPRGFVSLFPVWNFELVRQSYKRVVSRW